MLCKFCKSYLLEDAIYCKECSKFQTLSSAFISKIDSGAVFSALPILTLCVVFLYDHVAFPYSDMSISVLECSLDGVRIAASNTGARPGILVQGHMTEIADGKVAETRLLIADQLGQSGSAATIINPGATSLIPMSFRGNDADHNKASLNPTASKACQYKITIDVVDFGRDTPKPKALTACPCPGS